MNEASALYEPPQEQAMKPTNPTQYPNARPIGTRRSKTDREARRALIIAVMTGVRNASETFGDVAAVQCLVTQRGIFARVVQEKAGCSALDFDRMRESRIQLNETMEEAAFHHEYLNTQVQAYAKTSKKSLVPTSLAWFTQTVAASQKLWAELKGKPTLLTPGMKTMLAQRYQKRILAAIARGESDGGSESNEEAVKYLPRPRFKRMRQLRRTLKHLTRSVLAARAPYEGTPAANPTAAGHNLPHITGLQTACGYSYERATIAFGWIGDQCLFSYNRETHELTLRYGTKRDRKGDIRTAPDLKIIVSEHVAKVLEEYLSSHTEADIRSVELSYDPVTKGTDVRIFARGPFQNRIGIGEASDYDRLRVASVDDGQRCMTLTILDACVKHMPSKARAWFRARRGTNCVGQLPPFVEKAIEQAELYLDHVETFQYDGSRIAHERAVREQGRRAELLLPLVGDQRTPVQAKRSRRAVVKATYRLSHWTGAMQKDMLTDLRNSKVSTIVMPGSASEQKTSVGPDAPSFMSAYAHHWSRDLLRTLHTRTHEAGMNVLCLDDAGTSTHCPVCHEPHPSPELGTWECPSCALTLYDRDVHGALALVARVGTIRSTIGPLTKVDSVARTRTGVTTTPRVEDPAHSGLVDMHCTALPSGATTAQRDTLVGSYDPTALEAVPVTGPTLSLFNSPRSLAHEMPIPDPSTRMPGYSPLQRGRMCLLAENHGPGPQAQSNARVRDSSRACRGCDRTSHSEPRTRRVRGSQRQGALVQRSCSDSARLVHDLSTGPCNGGIRCDVPPGSPDRGNPRHPATLAPGRGLPAFL